MKTILAAVNRGMVAAVLVVTVVFCVMQALDGRAALAVELLTGLGLFGAVTVTQLRRTNDMAEYSVIATADADTVTGNIVHGMSANPRVSLLAILAAAAISLWRATTIDGTNIVLTKSTTAGSGDAAAQVRVRVERER